MKRNYERGTDRWNAKLTPEAVRAIRILGPSTKNASLAAQFGVSEASIENVRRGRTWRHV